MLPLFNIMTLCMCVTVYGYWMVVGNFDFTLPLSRLMKMQVSFLSSRHFGRHETKIEFVIFFTH